MLAILAEDACIDTYGRKCMYQALLLRQRPGVHIPSERTVYQVMEEMGISHRPKRKPNGITKADREARKSDDLLKRALMSRSRSASRTSPKSRPGMADSTSPPSSTVSTPRSSAWQWTPT